MPRQIIQVFWLSESVLSEIKNWNRISGSVKEVKENDEETEMQTQVDSHNRKGNVSEQRM